MFEMPKPTAEHKKVERIAGNWTGEETMMPSPWDPKGGIATAKMSSRVSLNGFAVIGDYEQFRDGVSSFAGHSVWTYDLQAATVLMHWWDTIGQAVNVFKGNFVGDKIVMNCVDHQGHSRLTYNFTGPNSMRNKMEMSKDGLKWTTLFEGTYTRQS